ncbi:Dps family protein, partial [Citrobacter amalonaticus]
HLQNKWVLKLQDPGFGTRRYSDDAYAAKNMIENLVQGQETVVKTARSLFPLVNNANDEATADLLTQRIQLHEKTAWMLRSLLE